MALYRYVANVDPNDGTTVIKVGSDTLPLGSELELDSETQKRVSERFVLERVNNESSYTPKVEQKQQVEQAKEGGPAEDVKGTTPNVRNVNP